MYIWAFYITGDGRIAMEIRHYQPNDEVSWVRCRVLSFLDTAYYDQVLTKKETYLNPSIELVAIHQHQVVGLLDIECEQIEKTICTSGNGQGGMIWHIAIHPDYQRRGIGQKLLEEAEQLAKEKGLAYLEAWTRDDEWVNRWYRKNEFVQIYSYLHEYMEGKDELRKVVCSRDEMGLQMKQAFAHYSGTEQEEVKSTFRRVYECRGYQKDLKRKN